MKLKIDNESIAQEFFEMWHLSKTIFLVGI